MDGVDGLWSSSEAAVAKYAANGPIECAIGAVVVFHWPSWWHNVVLMASRAHYDGCDFEGAAVLAGDAPARAGHGTNGYYYECAAPGEVAYLSCSIGDHCSRGQKVEVRVSATMPRRAERRAAAARHSMARVMALLGYSVTAEGFRTLTRGYQTEALANRTLELVWCLEPHCPTSALDWDASATTDGCLAEVNNLAGFLSRSGRCRSSAARAPTTTRRSRTRRGAARRSATSPSSIS